MELGCVNTAKYHNTAYGDWDQLRWVFDVTELCTDDTFCVLEPVMPTVCDMSVSAPIWHEVIWYDYIEAKIRNWSIRYINYKELCT